MRRFYLRIYLALFGSLAVFALLAGMTVGLLRLFDDRPARSWPEATTDIAERLLPPDRDRGSLASELAFWSERSGFDLALLSPAGDMIAKAGGTYDITPAILGHRASWPDLACAGRRLWSHLERRPQTGRRPAGTAL